MYERPTSCLLPCWFFLDLFPVPYIKTHPLWQLGLMVVFASHTVKVKRKTSSLQPSVEGIRWGLWTMILKLILISTDSLALEHRAVIWCKNVILHNKVDYNNILSLATKDQDLIRIRCCSSFQMWTICDLCFKVMFSTLYGDRWILLWITAGVGESHRKASNLDWFVMTKAEMQAGEPPGLYTWKMLETCCICRTPVMARQLLFHFLGFKKPVSSIEVR